MCLLVWINNIIGGVTKFVTLNKYNKMTVECFRVIIHREEIAMNNIAEIDELIKLSSRLNNQLSNTLLELPQEDVKEIKEALHQSIRKLSILSCIEKRHVICITGLQGVGKTTLIKNFYGLPDDSLNISQARGEAIPIFITEKDISNPEYFSIEYCEDEKESYLQSKEIPLDDFKEKSKSISRDGKIMYLEINVPYKYTHDDGVSFLLMPGYEKGQLDYWRDLINFSVRSSDVALFVTNYSSFTKISNKVLLDELREIFGDASLICAYTWAESSRKYFEQVKKEIKELYSLSDEQIIATDSYLNEEENEKWRTELINAVNHYKGDPNDTVYNSMLSDIQQEINTTINLIKELVANAKSKLIIEEESESSMYFKEYDREVAKIRRQLSKNLKNELGKARQRSIKWYEDSKIPDDAKGKFKEKLKGVKRILFSDSIRDKRAEKELIEKSLKNHDEARKEIPLYVESIYTMFLKDEATPDSLKYLLISNADENDITKDYHEDKVKDLTNDINYLIYGKEAKDINGNEIIALSEKSDNLLSNVAELGSYYFAKKIVDEFNNDYFQKLEIVPPVSEEIDLEEKMQASQKLGLGVFAMAGLDLLPDGKIDILTTISEALGISTKAAMGIFGGVMAASSVVTLGRDITNIYVRDYENATSIIHEYYNSIENDFMSAYDDCMEELKARILVNLRCRRSLDKKIPVLINTEVVTSDLETRINKIFATLTTENNNGLLSITQN